MNKTGLSTTQNGYFVKHFLLIALSLLFTFAPTSGDAENLKEFKREISKVEKYLQNLTTGRARFVQTTHDGTQLVGTFYLSRPGKLKFEYDPPLEDFVVADGFFIYFYDAELGEQTNAPIGNTLADFFLRKNVKLKGDITVSGVRRSGGYLQVTLVQTADPEAGRLILGFKEDEDGALTLNKWRIIDGQGLITEIELFYFKTGITHPSGLFAYKDPKTGKVIKLNE